MIAAVFVLLTGGPAWSDPAPADSPAATTAEAAPSDSNDTPGLELIPLAEGVWLHRSYKYLPGFGPFPSNGLVLATPDGAVLIDTAWTLPQSVELFDWTTENVGPVRAVFVTHWHDDRTAGIGEATRRGVPTFGGRRTREEATARGAPSPRRLIDDVHALSDLGIEGELFYPGPGHTVDNLVVWLPRQRMLFGGCLVKSATSRTLGYVADADIDAWSRTLNGLHARYPEIEVVVPGHGAPGDTALIDHTAALVGAALAKREADEDDDA